MGLEIKTHAALGIKYTDWSPTLDELVWLEEFVRSNSIKTVLEFGPGASTQAMLRGGASLVLSHESDNSVWWQWRETLSRCYDKELDLCCTPLDGLSLGNLDASYPFFRRFDLGFVDAPNGLLHYYARLGPMLCCADCCKRIALHDTHREGEKRTLEIMLNLGWKIVERFDKDKGICVLERKEVKE